MRRRPTGSATPTVERLYLRYEEWPRLDKDLWNTAFRSRPDLFADGGPGAELAERTVEQLQYAYGKFLYFLSVKHSHLLQRAPARRLNTKIIKSYVKFQPATCGGVTASLYLYHLWFALRYLCPKHDWSWLLSISKRIGSQARPRAEQSNLVTSETLYRVGIRLMDEALACRRPPTSWRMQTGFRDGLAIALLALVPLRRRTLSALRIGTHLIKTDDRWSLEIPAADVKSRRPLDYPISGELSERIDLYINEIRSQTAGANTHDYLWASSRGRPMNGHVLDKALRRRLREALGFPISLHHFRRAAATFWSMRDPVNVRAVRDLLGHTTFTTTERHYIMAQSRLAGRALARAVAAIRVR